MRTIADIVARTKGQNASSHCGCSGHLTGKDGTHSSDDASESLARWLRMTGYSAPNGFGKGFPFEPYPEMIDPTPPHITPSFGPKVKDKHPGIGKCSKCDLLLNFIPGVRHALRELVTYYPPKQDYTGAPQAVFSKLFDVVLNHLTSVILDISRACAISDNRTPIMPDWALAKPVYEDNNPFTTKDDVLSNLMGSGLLIQCATACPNTIRSFCEQIFGVLHDLRTLIDRRVEWTSQSFQSLVTSNDPYIIGLTDNIGFARVPKLQVPQLVLRLECSACALKLDPGSLENFNPADQAKGTLADGSFDDSL